MVTGTDTVSMIIREAKNISFYNSSPPPPPPPPKKKQKKKHITNFFYI